MKICKLCNTNQADKKGSHIVPHFLLKRIENIEGKNSRDYELGFVIQEFETKSYFGRSVPTEKLEEIYGELTDNDIEKNKHPLIVDNFFCSYCEDRFAKIEDEYAKTLGKFDNKPYYSGIPSGISLLFWASVLWRVSINKKSGMELTEKQNETLRSILDRVLSKKLSDIDFENLLNSKDINHLSYRLLRCPNYSINHATHMVCNPKLRHPYSLLVDEFLLFFAFNNNYKEYQNNDFFGIKEVVFEAPINSVNIEEEQVYPINEQLLENFTAKLVYHMKSIRIKKLNEFWDVLHVSLGGKGKGMPENIKRELLTELTSEEKKLGRSHNIEDLRNTTFKVLQKYER
jgi:hypothetical protein